MSELISPELTLRIVAWLIGGLLLMSLVGALYTIMRRLQNDRRERDWRDRERRWTGAIVSALSEEISGEELHQDVLPGEELPFLDVLVRFAGRVRGEEADRVRLLAQPYLPHLLPLTRARESAVRARAVQTLGILGLPAFDQELLRAVDDPSPFVSMLAARALARYGGAEYVDLILSRLHRFVGWNREYLVTLLRTLGPDAAPSLRRFLGNSRPPIAARGAVADALERLHDLGSVEVARKLLREVPPPELAPHLLRLLAKLGGEEDLPTVLHFLRSPHSFVRQAAYLAIGSLARGRDREILREGLDDPSPWVVLGVARILLAHGAVATLEREVAEGRGPGRQAAGQVLAEAGQ